MKMIKDLGYIYPTTASKEKSYSEAVREVRERKPV
jgi:hypothetical protein